MKLSDLTSCKSIAIWGLGRDGKQTFREIKDLAPTAKIITFDENVIPEDDEFASNFYSFTKALTKLRNHQIDCLIRSPGVSIYRQEMMELRKVGIPIHTSLDLWLSTFREQTFPIVVTGTKGKSTTSSLIYHIFRSMETDAILIGNIGIPMLSCNKPPAHTIIEASSYQIADLTIGPAVGVVLNLFQEHIDWHKTKENYFLDKLRLLDLPSIQMKVACFSNKELRSRLQHRSDIVWYDQQDSGFWADQNSIMFAQDKLLSLKDFQLRGRHNLSNICAALTVAYAKLDADPKKLAETLMSFTPLDHRLQTVFNWRGIQFINDSISTTTDSSLAAVRAFRPSPIILILGGKDRGLQFDAFLKLLDNEKVRHIIFTGDSGNRVFQEIQFKNYHFDTSYSADLQSAVSKAISVAEAGDVVLLSPASPSYGEFSDFEERGRFFTEIVSKLCIF
ncbi:MAG: UDP-N-acetylmuramoyl-L-alanine--D-glutamate ligase [Candidatus Zambryskibacteria bacterium]|nr:UDP-N-acetylmuramoyl-L-alanine--D-glutamate ligase [Candidatus Zambryskibacteria bacterium]